MSTTAAIVVTFNRIAFLRVCLRSLSSQTYPLDAIILVDNASTDETNEWIVSQASQLYSNLIYMRRPTNTGGAGGFRAGMEKALSLGFDWFWMMDDDVSPATSCLEELFKYSQFSMCIHPRRILPDGKNFNWGYGIDKRSGFEYELDTKSMMLNGWMTVYSGCFEGMLVSSYIVSKVGLPRSCYFMNRDDSEFGYNASKYTNLLLVRDAILTKLKPLEERQSSLSIYLLFRNYVGFLARKLSSDKLIYFLVAFKFLAHYSIRELCGLRCYSFVAIWLGFFDGLLNKFGRESRYL